MDTLAIILSLVGNAWAISADGVRRALKVGDALSATDTLVTEDATRIELSFGDNQELTLLGEQELTPEARAEFEGIAALQSLNSAENAISSSQVARSATSEESEGHNFVQLVPIADVLEADGFNVLTVARIHEYLTRVGMSLEVPEFFYDEHNRDGSYSRLDDNERHTGETGARIETPTININVVAGDDIVSVEEAEQTIELSGTVGGGARAGDKIEVVVNGKTYHTTVNPDGKTWAVDVPGSELAQDSQVQASVTSREPNGIPNTVTTTRPYDVDVETPTVEVELEKGSGPNGEYNAKDTEDGTVKGKITFGPETQPGDKITVTDKDGNPILDSNGDPITDYELTPEDIENGITVDVPVNPGDKDVELNVEVTDPAGNTGTGSDSNPVDNITPELKVELQGDLNNDGIYNAAEIIDGKVPAKVTLDKDTVEVGDRLVIKDTSGEVLIDRPVTQADIDNGVDVKISVAHGDTEVSVEATITDPVGNTFTDTAEKDVDNIIPELGGDQGLGVEFIGTGDDGVYNKKEIDDNGGEVDAKVTFDQDNTEPGDTVTIKDKEGNIVKDENGVPMEDYPLTQGDIDNGIIVKVPVADGDTEVKVEATVTDTAGNKNSADATNPVDNVTPTLSIELVGHDADQADGVYNAAEIIDGKVPANITLDATVEVGDKLVVTAEDGTVLLERNVTQADIVDGITVQVPVADGATNVEVTATITDPAGNSSDATDTKPVDNVTPTVEVELEPGSGPNGEYNEDDGSSVEGKITFDPDTTNPGDKITVTDKDGNPILDGNGDPLTNYELTQNDIDNGITVDVPVNPGDEDVKLNVEVTDPAGNSSTGSDSNPVDNITPTLSIELVGHDADEDDGVYNAAEIIDGKVPAEITLDKTTVKVGDKLVVTAEGGTVLLERFVTQDDIDNGITVQVPVADGATNVEVTATITDPAGNSSDATDTKPVDNVTPTVEVELEPGSGPNGEYNEDDGSSVEGKITFDPDTTNPGDKITVTDKDGNPILDGNGDPLTNYELTQNDIDNGITVDVPVNPGDENVELNVEVTDPAGNSSTGSDSNPVDNITPTLSIELVGHDADQADGVYNAAEIIDGKVPADITLDKNTVEVGDKLVVTAEGGTVLLERFVTQDDIDNGITVQVPVADGDTNVEVTATITDSAGNSSNATDTKPVDNVTPTVEVELEPGTGTNGKYNAEDTKDGSVKGKITFDPDTTKPGDKITVTDKDGDPILDNNGDPLTNYELTQDDIDNGITVDVPVADGQTEVELNVEVTDPAGNGSTGSDSNPVDNITPTLSIELVGHDADQADGVYNAAEIIDGKVPADITLDKNTVEVGDKLVVTAEGGTVLLERFVTQDDIDNGITVQVPVADGATNVEVTATITDPAGNSSDATDTKPVDNVTPTVEVELEPGSGPNGEYNEDDGSSVEGKITFDPDTTNPGDKITVTDKDGNPILDGNGDPLTDYELTQNDIDNGITVDVPVNPGDENVGLNVEVTDPAGNSSTGSDSNPVDNVTPTVEVELEPGTGPNGDYNAADTEGGKVSGTVTFGPETEVGDTVQITDKDDNILLERPITQDDLDNGITVDVPVVNGQTEVELNAKVTDPAGNSSEGSDDNPVDNVTPGVSVEFQGAGDDGVYNVDEIANGEVDALVTLDGNTEVGDHLVVTDGKNNTLFDGPVTQAHLDNGLTVQVPVDNADTELTVNAEVTDAAGNSSDATAKNPVDGITPTVEVELEPGTGPNGDYNAADTEDGKVSGTVTFGPETEVGDTVQLTDKDGNIIIERPLTQDDLDNGITVDVPVVNGQTEVELNAKVTDPAGNSSEGSDDNPVDNVTPTVEVELEPGSGTNGKYNAVDTDDGFVKGKITLGGNVDEDDTLKLTYTDENGIEQTLPGYGNYVITDADITRGYIEVDVPVVNGQTNVELKAEVTDPAGNSSTGSDNNPVDNVVVTAHLTVDEDTVFEGSADLEYTITLRDSNGDVIEAANDIIVTTTLGDVVIKAGDSSATFTVPVQGDDVYIDPETITNEITNIAEDALGGEAIFENLGFDNTPVTTEVEDTIDTTTITLSDVTVNEGADITITATVDNAPQGSDLVITLDNNEVITIAAGQTSGSVTFANPKADTPYQDGETQEYKIDSATGGNYEALDTTDVSTVTVVDTVDTTTITLDNPTVDEGEAITITATVDNEVTDSDLVITLDNGETITIEVGQTTGSVTFPNPKADSPYVDGETQEYGIIGTTGGNYEALDTTAVSTVTVEDTEDTTTVTLTADDVEEGEDITIKATVDNAPDTDLVLTLNNGQQITIEKGKTEGEVTFANPNTEDVYKDGETLTYEIVESTGGNYEKLDTNATVDVEVSDTIDTTTITLSDVTVEEGANITITATVGNAPQGSDLVITLDNNEVITIAAGQTSGSVTFTNPKGDTPYQDGETQEYKIDSATGGNYEALDTTDVSTVTVVDTVDTTTITLDNPTVDEGEAITITATVDNAPQGSDLEITLDNGEIITIVAGQTTGSVTFPNPKADSPYVDGETQEYGIIGTTGGNYEALDTTAVSTVTVEDTEDTTTVTLTADDVDEGEAITIKASVDNAPDTNLVLTLNNGQQITIEKGKTEGEVTFANPNTEDVYKDSETLTYSVIESTGGNYEKLDTSATVDVKVSDTIDTTTITLSDVTVEEGAAITITATVDNAPQGSDLIITLDNNEVITIAAGQTSGSVTFTNPKADTPYTDGETQTYSITDATGGNYEALDTTDVSTVTVVDTVDTTTITLDNPTVDEGEAITITATVDNAPQGSDLEITLDNGQVITIIEGQTTGSVTFPNPKADSPYVDGETQEYGITGTTGGNYEHLDTTAVSTVTVEDTENTTTVTLTADDVDEGEDITIKATVDNAPDTDLVLTLNNGQQITIEKGKTEGEVTFANPNTEDVYKDSETLTYEIVESTGGNYEKLDTNATVDVEVSDTESTVTAYLTVNKDEVDEGDPDNLVYTVTLKDENGNTVVANNKVTITTDLGDITIEAGNSYGTLNVPVQPNDVYVSEGTVTNKITAISEENVNNPGAFEGLEFDAAEVSTKVNDIIDTTTVTLEAKDVNEGEDITIKATVDNAPDTNLVLTLNNGQQITIEAGKTEGEVTFANPNTEDVYKDGETLTYEIVGSTGGNYEELDTSATVEVEVRDTIDPVYAIIEADTSAVLEGGEIKYTVKLVDENGALAEVPTGSSVEVALKWTGTATDTAGESDVDGSLPTSITIPGGSSTAEFTVTTEEDNLPELSEQLTVVIEGVTDDDDKFEDLQIGHVDNNATVTIFDKPSISASDITVKESGLTGGSSEGDGSHIATGQMVVSAPTGLVSIEVGGQEIILAQLENAPITITVDGGELTINSFTETANSNGDAAQWKLDYTYTLEDKLTHDSNGTTGEQLELNLDLSVTAEDPTDSTSTITESGDDLVVTVIDDIPSIDLSGEALDTIVVSEADIAIAGNTASSSADLSSAFKDIIYGADGAASANALVYELVVSNAKSGLQSLDGVDIQLSLNSNGEIEGKVGNEVYLTISVDQDGEVTLTQHKPVKHPDMGRVGEFDEIRIDKGAISLKATATDGDGDTADASIAIGDRFVFQDDGPSVNENTGGGTVDEAHLATGSQAGAGSVVISGKFDGLDFGADGAGDIQFTEGGRYSTVGTLEREGFESGGVKLQYVISNDGHTLTAYRGNGRGDADKIFTVNIIDPQNASDNAGYEFTLQGALDHLNKHGDTLTAIDLLFDHIRVTDGDGDTAESSFEVTVKDDAPDETEVQEEVVDEDSKADNLDNTFNTNADAVGPDGAGNLGNTTIGDGSNGTIAPAHGTATVNPDGTITYVPNGNYSGKDTFTYTTTTDNETKTFTVEVTVNPISDAPDLEANKNLITNEDVSISLSLVTPEVADDTREIGANADFPERLGEITLTLSGAGADEAVLVKGNGDPLISDGNGVYKFVITDKPDLHLNGLDTANDPTVNYVTEAEYNAIMAKPGENKHENFEVEVKVESFEVDGSGNKLSNVDGAESTQTITVDVHAVTDSVELTADASSYTLTEDTQFDLTNHLTETFGGDFDGTEQFWYEIENLAPGTTVEINGKTYTADNQGKVTTEGDRINLTDSSKNPDFKITPPTDFSGDMNGVKVTINVEDRDSDSPNAAPNKKSDAVIFDIFVNPKAGDVDLVGAPVETKEDTAVNFMRNIKVTDDVSDGGNEVITEVKFKLPEGWTLTKQPAASDAGDAAWTVSGNDTGGYTIEFTAGSEENRELALSQFEVTPPAHSSKNKTITVKVTTEDTNTVNGTSVSDTQETTLNIDVEVTPVAEKVGEDIDGDGTADLTMTDGHSYTTAGVEDQWFSLGTEGSFDLKAGWSNQDGKDEANGGVNSSNHGSEETFALFTPELVADDGTQVSANGSQFRWGPDGEFSAIFGGDPIEVPIEYLDTLQFKGPENFSGMFKIKVQAKTVDYDEDDPSIKVEAVSGEAWLENVLIAPKADTVTTGLTARVKGNEDEMMNLSIRPKSSDPSETFDVTLDNIPDGAILTYGDYAITSKGVFEYTTDGKTVELGEPVTDSNISVTPGANPGENWSITFEDFYQNESTPPKMTITAPLDSNEEFKLGVSSQAVDTLTLNEDPTSMLPTDPNDPDYVEVTDNGDGTYTITSKSDQEELSITVSPKGVADPANFELEDVGDGFSGEYSEEAVETSGIQVKDLIVTAELKDDDGSETLTFKISGLPEGFTLAGGTFIGGSGESREWSLTKGQLENAVIHAPENYNGALEFNIHTITTENDGDSLDEQHAVKVKVTPAPEADMNLSQSIAEDVSTQLDFSVVHKNGDDDEFISKVWISADSVAGSKVTLFDSNGDPLVAETVSGVDGVPDGNYFVVDKDDLHNIYAQGDANWHGKTDFEVKYEVTDPGNDGLDDATAVFDGTYEIEVTPVTDQVTLDVSSNKDIEMTAVGTTTVTLNVGNDDGQGGGDYDGSEQLTRIIVENFPEGVVVTNPGAHYIGDGVWILEVDAAGGQMDGSSPVAPEIHFKVHSSAGGLDKHPVKITVISEDAGNGQETTASTTVTLSTGFTQGGEEASAEIRTWEQKAFDPTEDTAFTLDQAIAAEIDDNGIVDSGFTITLTDLPEGTTVTGMTKTTVEGEEVWTATRTGGQEELEALLGSITVTPPADFNSNKGDFDYNATLTTHTPTGGSANEDANILQQVTPVTDQANVLITADPVDEGEAIDITIDISNAADDPAWTLVDGKLYLQIDPEAGLEGELQDANGNPLSTIIINDVSGVPDGEYYVIDVDTDVNSSVDLKFMPSDKYKNGNVVINTWVQGQETHADNIITTEASHTAVVNPVNDGVKYTVEAATGEENPGEPEKANLKLHGIEVKVTGDGLLDTDGSEEIYSILLEGVPNGFLVFMGNSPSDAAQAEPADNTGGSATNSWMLGSELPKYIAIVPPKNWSGTVDGLKLTVNSGESELSEITSESFDFSLTVDPVANGVTLSPTASFGQEGEIIGFNLNASLEDLQQAGETDQHAELITLELDGLGEHAAFYIGDELISGSSLVQDHGNGRYTITGLSQDDVDNLGFIQAKSEVGSITVKAQSQEYEVGTDGKPDVSKPVGNPSAWSEDKTVTTNISSQYGTTGADELLYTGGFIDGRGGDDTIQLRFGEDVTGSELAANLKNIETIDLSIAGDNKINGLSIEDVLSMTDNRNVLEIFGDSDDKVTLDSGWTEGSTVDDYTVYTGYTGASNDVEVTLKISNDIVVD